MTISLSPPPCMGDITNHERVTPLLFSETRRTRIRFDELFMGETTSALSKEPTVIILSLS